MKWFALGLSAALACTGRSACADPAIDPLPTRGGQIEAQAHFGVATAPFDITALPQAKGQAFVFLASGRYSLLEPLSLALHVPLVLGSVAQPAGSYIDTAALGNPMFGAHYRFYGRRSDRSQLALTAALEVGLPLASHAQDLMPNRVLAIADGIEGRGHPDWFTPGVLPITASTALHWTSAAWTLEAELRLPLLVRVSQASLPNTMTNTNDFGFGGALGLEARYRLSRRLSLAAATQLFFDLVPAAEHVREISRLQDLERLSLQIHFGSLASLVLDLQTAIAGELAGSTVAGGLRAGVNFR